MTMPGYVIGIDPGSCGAIACVHDRLGTCLGVWDMPADERGLVALRNVITEDHGIPTAVYLEKVSAMPKQGVSSTFKFGMSFGACRLWAALWDVRWELVTPQKWKQSFGLLNKEKMASVLLARRLWPNAPLERVKDLDRAHALLIAEWGRQHGKPSTSDQQ